MKEWERLLRPGSSRNRKAAARDCEARKGDGERANWLCRLRFSCKAAARRHSGSVPRAMQHANDHKFSFSVQIVESVAARKTYADTGRKIISRGTGMRQVKQWFAVAHDLINQPCRCRFRGLDGDVGPYLGKGGLGGIG